MPRFPGLSAAVSAMRGSVYSALAHRAARLAGETYPFHVGDTWKEPPPGCRMEDLRVADHKGLHQYSGTQGVPALLDVIAERTERRSGVATTRANVLVTAGVTAGLAHVVATLLQPGDEMLVLAPHWPLVQGIVQSFGAVPVLVPFFGVVSSADGAVAALEAKRSDRTAALYVNTPNNPTGFAIPRAWMEALVAWAREHDLWLFFDEVYEDFVYEGEHVPGRALAPERSFSGHSFSKAYGMAGNRCGYLVGPAELIPQLLKISTHHVYSAPTASQFAALRVLQGAGDAWLAETVREYRDVGAEAARLLGVPPPAGGAFLFLDVAPSLRGGGLDGFLEACADDGLLVSPGTSFGPYPTHLRICFTCAPPDVVLRGVRVLARHL